jgi:hypothetical protein
VDESADLPQAFASESNAGASPVSAITPKAKTAYNQFFALWKDADPGISILVGAKSEYAKPQ